MLELYLYKVIHVTGRGGPYECDTSRLQHFLDNRLVDSTECSALRAGHSLLVSVRGPVDPGTIVPLEGLDQFKNPMFSSGIKPSTFRLVS
jgi:hypothetical protein